MVVVQVWHMKTMISVAAIGTLVGFALVASPAAAADCNGTITQFDTAAGTFYVDDRTDGEATLNHWVYLESNGIEGLQSGGASAVLGDLDADSCYELDENGDPIAPDTLIF